jgi:hypothetical protein
MAESAEGARLLSECRVTSSTEGSNPSLSATGIEKADTTLASAFFDNHESTKMGNLVDYPSKL